MLSNTDSIKVRTARDKAEIERERILLERIQKENENPFERVAMKVEHAATKLYSEYLYSSGTLLSLVVLWTLYPSFVRYRHANIRRYRGSQLKFRRWFFGTQHLPKWDKKYLQRIAVPPPPTRNDVTVSDIVAGAAAGRSTTAARGDSGFGQNEDARELTTVKCDQSVAPFQASPSDAFSKVALTSAIPKACTFARDDGYRATKSMSDKLRVINEEFYSSKEKSFSDAVNLAVNSVDVYDLINKAAKESEVLIVLREDHTVRRSIPPGWQIWWASHEEYKRRAFTNLFMMVLVFFRFMQDRLDVPDMPTVIQ